jgi:hypothetical protein
LKITKACVPFWNTGLGRFLVTCLTIKDEWY